MLLSQNRQFQWFSESTYIYPIVPAYAATLLAREGYDVVWDDGIAEEKTYQIWLRDLVRVSPDIVAIETKTPVIKRHWRIIEDIKEQIPDTQLILFGDHVTALPRESMENSEVDYVLCGGDYDFLMLNLVKYLNGEETQLEQGIWYKENGDIRSTGQFQLDHDLNELPFIDRDLSKWKLYAYQNGNYKITPGTYVMAGRDCWWGKCEFCSWATLYPGSTYRTFSVERHLDEIGILIEKYGIREYPN